MKPKRLRIGKIYALTFPPKDEVMFVKYLGTEAKGRVKLYFYVGDRGVDRNVSFFSSIRKYMRPATKDEIKELMIDEL